MHVCDLTDRYELHSDTAGRPYLVKLRPVGLSPAGYILELYPGDRPEWARLIEAWQADPRNDSLRATGDPRYQAAASAAARCKGRFAP